MRAIPPNEDYLCEPCAATLLRPLEHTFSEAWPAGSMLPLPGVDDQEGERVDPELPFVVDAHVHLFPDRMFDAIWHWFDEHGWPVRYKLYSSQIIAFLRARGVGHMVALHYAHKPGMARAMNRYVASVVAEHRDVSGLATVFPGEPNAKEILEEAFAMGLRGVKLHCHVQCFSPDDAALAEVYDACVAHDLPLVMHAGREPHSDAYRCDPRKLCAASRTEAVLRGWPRLRLLVPHLGADELDGYRRLLERHDNLWLDTTMVVGDYFEGIDPWPVIAARPERILYGTDFPNLPYAWDRELRALARGRDDRTLPALLGQNARELFRMG